VRWYHRAKEQQAIEQGVRAQTGYHHDCQWWEEDVDHHEQNAIRQIAHCCEHCAGCDCAAGCAQALVEIFVPFLYVLLFSLYGSCFHELCRLLVCRDRKGVRRPTRRLVSLSARILSRTALRDRRTAKTNR